MKPLAGWLRGWLADCTHAYAHELELTRGAAPLPPRRLVAGTCLTPSSAAWRICLRRTTPATSEGERDEGGGVRAGRRAGPPHLASWPPCCRQADPTLPSLPWRARSLLCAAASASSATWSSGRTRWSTADASRCVLPSLLLGSAAGPGGQQGGAGGAPSLLGAGPWRPLAARRGCSPPLPSFPVSSRLPATPCWLSCAAV